MTDELSAYQAQQYRRRHPIPSAQGRTRRRPMPVVPAQPVHQRVRHPMPQGWRLYATPIVLGIIGITACIIGIDSNYHHAHAPHQAHEVPSSRFSVGALVGESDTQILTNKNVIQRTGDRQFSWKVLGDELHGLAPHSFSDVSAPVVLPDAQEPLLCEVKAWLIWPTFASVRGTIKIYLLRSVADEYEDPSQTGSGRRPDVIVHVSSPGPVTPYSERVLCPQGHFRVVVKNDTNEPMAAGESVITIRVVGTE